MRCETEAGEGAPILFLHGWTMAGDIFADAARRLSPMAHCLAPDLPGHGAPPAPGGHSIDAAATALAEFIDRRDLRGLTLVGWSMGASVAWTYLDRFGPARIARMVSLDMSPRLVNGPDWALGLAGQDGGTAPAKAAWLRANWPRAAAMIAAGMFGTEGTSALLPRATAEQRVLRNDRNAMADIWESLLAADLRPAIARLAVPMLVVSGAQSRLYPKATALWLARTAPSARHIVFAASGHSPHLEEPETFARAIAQFVTTTPSTSAA